MGLFSSVLHLRDVSRDQLLPVLDDLLLDAGSSQSGIVIVPPTGPFAMAGYDDAVTTGPCYLVTSLNGRWITVIEAHFGLGGALHLADLGRRLSSALSCYSLALFVHDDDLFLYNLDRDGQSLDGDNRCPPY